jgi:hypothetical protein
MKVQSVMNDYYMICSKTCVKVVEQIVQQLSLQQTKPLEETNSDAFMLSVVFARNVSLNKKGLKNVNAFDVFRGQTFGDSWQPIVRGP